MTAQETLQIHATCVALNGTAVLLRGAPGSGKSDLALRLIDDPGFGICSEPVHGKLVGDDQIILRRSADDLMASPAGALAGMLEIRGIGIIKVPYLTEARLALVVDIEPNAKIERLPDIDCEKFEALGVSIPRFVIDADQASAAAKVRAVFQAVRNNLLDRRIWPVV